MWENDVLVTAAYCFALFIILFVVYIILFEENSKRNAKYRLPGKT